MNFNLKDFIDKNGPKLKKYRIYIFIAILLIALYFALVKPYLQFKRNENVFKDAVLSYCESKTNCMPKEGAYKGYTLEKVYEDVMLKETLYVPYSNKMCDSSSWVRIFNEDGKYKTYVYLKCGIFSSLIDHEGPKITLEGAEEIMVPLKGEFVDPGVSKVKDNKDGTIDNSLVNVQGTVMTDSAGEYTLTYTAYDKLKNKGAVVRKVKVVSTLKDAIIKDTNGTNVYVGPDATNSLLFSGMLWRIVGINEDGTIKVVTEDGVAALTYGNHTYDESNVVKYLNDVFLKSINNYEKYLKSDSRFCTDTITDTNNITCNELSNPNYVGLLSIDDVKKTKNGEYTYLTNNVPTWLSNKAGIKPYSSKNGLIITSAINDISSVRAVVNLKPDELYIQGGSGTSANPYKINDYEYAKAGDLLNTRLIGERVEYSGMQFIITGFDNDKNIILTSVGPYRMTSAEEYTVGYSDYDNKTKILDQSIEGNMGYKLENDLLLLIDSKYMLKNTWKLNKYSYMKYYNEIDSKDYEAYISIPNGEDLFSGNNGARTYQNKPYALANYSDNTDNLFIVVNTVNGYGYVVSAYEFTDIGARIKIKVKKDVVISGGAGTENSPYTLR